MARQVPITQKQISLNARVQETGGPRGPAQLSQNIAGELRQRRDQYQEQAIENAYLKGTTVLARDLDRLEQQHKNDPDALGAALEEYGTSFMDEVNDPNMRARFEVQLEKGGQTALARATASRNALIGEQARFDNLQAFETIKARLPSISRGLLSADNAIAEAASQELQEVLMRSQGIMGATDPDGMPLFNAAVRVNQLVDMKDTALQSATEDWLENQPDKLAALQSFDDGELTINLPNGEGGFDTINVRDSVSPQTAKLIQSAAKAQIAEQNALIEQQRAVTSSNLELAIETVRDDPAPDPAAVGPQLPQLSRAEKLGMVLQQIENSPLYNDTPEGIIKGNQLRQKVFGKLEKEQERYEQITAGSAFASGQRFLNRQDSKAVDAYDKYYESIEPGLSQVEPFERNMALTAIIDNAKAVPSRLTGDIQRIARSNDVAQIAQAADLIDRVGAQNPHLIADIAPQKDLARIQMINQRINQGYTEEEAIKKVDELLDPRNEITIGEATAELKEKKVDYRGQAVQAFDSAGFFKELFTFGMANGLDTAATGQAKTIDGVTAAYRVAFEDHYRITRDKSLAKEYATNFVKGRYGVTNVNGGNQIMPYAPEKYYTVLGTGNDWMREQAISEAQKAMKNWLSPGGDKYGRNDLKKNLYVMPDPFVTPRTAEKGAPRYKLMYKSEDGSLLDVLGPQNYFFFEPDKERAALVNKAAKRQQVKEQFGGASLQLNLYRELEMARMGKDQKRIEKRTKQLTDLGVEVE